MERVLDWRSRHDEKSRNFPIRSLIGSTVTPRNRLWYESTCLDQGFEGACVGFGHTAELITAPYRTIIDAEAGNRYARDLYQEAKRIDEWAGEDYEGTSVLAGAKVLKSRGLIDGYRWAFNITDVRDAVITTGPVVLGIPWLDGMYETNASNRLAVTGDIVGGHCIIATGWLRSLNLDGKRGPVFRLRNSWGLSWGKRGSAYIYQDDLEWLLEQQGEAMVPIGSKKLVLTG